MSIEGVSLQETVCCIELGGVRGKFGLLPRKVKSLSELQRIVTKDCQDGRTLRKRIPSVFAKDAESPFSELLKKATAVSVALQGPFDGEGNCVDKNWQYPENLVAVCSQISGYTFAANNDAICFAKGAYKYQKLKKDTIAFPCLVVTLGTGIGAALIKDKKTYVGIELLKTGWPFSQLEETRKKQEQELQKEQTPQWGVHCLLGRPFFKWIATDEGSKISTHFQARVHALCRDVFRELEMKESIRISSIVIGGGNSRFLQAVEGYPCKTIILNPPNLTSDKVSQDIVQLLGCQRNLTKNSTQSLIPALNL